LPRRIRADEFRVDAFPDEDLLQKLRARGFIARRIRCVDAKVGDERVFRFAIVGILGDRRSALTGRGAEGEKEKNNFRLSPQPCRPFVTAWMFARLADTE
jgi:hypothetical protein